MNINLDSTKIIIKLLRVSSYSAFLLPVSRVAIKLDCKDTKSHIYEHINIFRLRGGAARLPRRSKII